MSCGLGALARMVRQQSCRPKLVRVSRILGLFSETSHALASAVISVDAGLLRHARRGAATAP